ncbi:MAG: proline dehydrogenase family protein [Candidatus Marinimicrobia bacterium]|nr:proline dehydrogenase family protein [Candidatus Neomarinimicrobiota bacterium]MBL7109383.1 proline dehydrogenase family protein [Candidatus Neomarinimicrobiota bacterium]
MLKLFNKIILSLIPFLPLSFVRLIAGRYVAGETKEEALDIVQTLNAKGYSATIDILGEHVETNEASKKVTENYLDLYSEIQSRNLDCNVSIKPTHIGLDIGETTFRDNLLSLLSKAEETDNFLRIDMENSPFTDVTIKLTQECFSNYKKVGTVFQAYLFRTKDDIAGMFGPEFNFRLCKGIYKEDPEIAIQNRQEINSNFIELLRLTFQNKGFAAIATHDLKLLRDVYTLIEELDVPKDRFEFQVLYGVPMSGWLEKHLSKGYKVRIYVPFGPDWYAYSTRRLKENPNIAGYILKNFIRRS